MDGAVGSQVETDVDTLVSLVKEKGKVSVEQAAKLLNLELSMVQTWVDFLVEEDILGIEYKFVTPFLYFNQDKKKEESSSEELKFEEKSVFLSKAKAKGVSEKRAFELWKNYLDSNFDLIKSTFFKKGHKRSFSDSQIKKLWEQYYEYLTKEE